MGPRGETSETDSCPADATNQGVADTTRLTLPLIGAGGEPVDFWRTVRSHGLAALPPNRIDHEARSLETVLPLPGGGARLTRLASPTAGDVTIVVGERLNSDASAWLESTMHRMLGLDADLSGFYKTVADEPGLAWTTRGAGRMLRGASVFEDVVKTICTTNCAWSATERMVGALVSGLGEAVPRRATDDPPRHAFPTPQAMAAAPAAFYQEVVRAGYRGRYLQALAEEVATGKLDLESLALPEPDGPTDDEARQTLLALPGVGPYAAAHVMVLIGRCRPLVLDSWTRPTFARLHGQPVTDAEIEAQFIRFGRHAGLAFWLVLTRDWLDDHPLDAWGGNREGARSDRSQIV